jgi:uncharacterized Zn finger protein
MSRYFGGFPEYVSVAQKRAKAKRAQGALKKKNPKIAPVLIQGSKIANTWWGKSWNQNLERYADYSNRIGRGRSYVRHGAVLDLQIKAGKIQGLVQGSRSTPYKISISIQALSKTTWKYIRESTVGQLDSLSELLAGKFPKSLQDIFFDCDEGVFPNPREIEFECSCPDWAYMCKHVAATLYGVGARLDQDPSLLFKLRNIQIDDLISQAIKRTSKAMLEKAETKSSRVMDDANLTEVFGIQLDENMVLKKRPSAKKKKEPQQDVAKSGSRKKRTVKLSQESDTPKKRVQKSRQQKEILKKQVKPEHTKPKQKIIKSPKRSVVVRGTFVDRVVSAVPNRSKTMRISDICAKVGLDKKQVQNAVSRAVAMGKLKSMGGGVYVRV